MKNTVIKITAATIGIFFSLTAFAQQTATAKPPQVSGPVLQTTTENTAPAAPPVDTKLHETAGKPSSFSGPAPVKANDNAAPAKVPEQKPTPATDKLVRPNPVKNG